MKKVKCKVLTKSFSELEILHIFEHERKRWVKINKQEAKGYAFQEIKIFRPDEKVIIVTI